ncbi:MAG: hypothetical protein ACLGQH_09250 [Acidobacteriota bacterium]
MRAFRRLSRLLLCAGLACLLTGQAGCGGPQPDVEGRQLETARVAFLDGRFLAAEAAYQSYLQAYPQGQARLEAWQRLIDINEDVRGDGGQAARLAETALLEFGGDPAASVVLSSRAARLRFDRREYAKAAALCQLVLDSPSAPDDHLLACHLLAARSDLARHDDARALARYAACRASRLPPSDTARCALAQAELLGRLSRESEAEPLLQDVFQAAGIDPALRAQAGFALGQLYEARNDPARAQDAYRATRPLHPNPMVVDKRLGYLQN